jgi:hypothetical protein
VTGTDPARFWPDMTPAEYHHAEGPPRLSQSIAKELVERSPWHAKRALDRRAAQHEDEGGESDEDKKRDTMDRGTIIHALLLGTPSPAVIVADPVSGEPFSDFRTKAAKEQKAKIRAAGKIAVIAHKVQPVVMLADRIRFGLLKEHGIDLVGDSELAVTWTERASDGTPVPCRGMLDHWLAADAKGRPTIYDVKVWASANPRVLVRKVHDMGVDIQAEAYTRAVEAVYPELAGRVRFVTLVCEVSTGLVTPIVFGGSLRQVGKMRWRRAIDLWARCSALNDWPGYTRGELLIDAPEWMIAAEIDSEHKSNDLAKYVEQKPAAEPDGYDDDSEGEDES